MYIPFDLHTKSLQICCHCILDW